MAELNKVILSEKDMPKEWYNVAADLPEPLPPIIRADGVPAGPADFAPVFPMEIIKQEVSTQKWIPIPDEVISAYKVWRPSPLCRAFNLEKRLKTPARIYYKNESVSAAGSHKLNTAIPQAYYNKAEGVKRMATETGAGQWGSAMSFATQFFGLKCTVYMVRVSYDQKPYRRFLMQTYGAEVFASPSKLTHAGQEVLKKDSNSLGSLGIAISEAVEDAATHDDTKYCLGSVLNHVCMHQTIIGLEIKKQMEMIGDYPDIISACVGGGSNFAGAVFPFVAEKMKGKDIRFLAVEPAACPTLTKGPYRYDFGDEAKLMPLAKMYTLGHNFMPSGIHAGGLRYHGDSPIVSYLVNKKLVEARSYKQIPCFEAAVLFAKSEGLLPAPESSHAIRAAIDEAIICRETKKEKAIVINLSGHGHFDLSAYESYLSGKMVDVEFDQKDMDRCIKELPDIK